MNQKSNQLIALMRSTKMKEVLNLKEAYKFYQLIFFFFYLEFFIIDIKGNLMASNLILITKMTNHKQNNRYKMEVMLNLMLLLVVQVQVQVKAWRHWSWSLHCQKLDVI